jgi:hypothetical protein
MEMELQTFDCTSGVEISMNNKYRVTHRTTHHTSHCPLSRTSKRFDLVVTTSQIMQWHVASCRVLDQISLTLCKVWGFHGGDCEECRLLGYKDPVCTSQEKYYVSATEPSRLMLWKSWGFLCGDYEECRLLGYKDPVRTSQEKYYVSATSPAG